MMQGRTSSRILTPLGLAVCFSLFGDLTLYTVLVTQLDEVGLSLAAVGVMLGVNRLIRIPGNPLTGVLLDRWGRRRLFVFGMLLGVLSTASYGLMRGFWPFLAGRLTWGIAWTCINVGGMTMVLDISTRSNRGRLTGIYNTWLQAGFALAPLVGGFLVDTISFRPAMLVCAGLTAIGLAVAVVALPETAQLAGRDTQREPRPALGLNLRRRLDNISWRRIRRLLRDNRNLVTVSLLLLITLFAGEGVTLSTTSLLLQQRFGPNVVLGRLALGVATAGGILLALRSLLAGAVGPLAGHLSDAYTGRWPVIVGSLAIGMVGFGLLAFAASPATIVLGVILGAVSGGAALATLAAQMGDLTPTGREGVVMGAYATVGDVGSMAGPFLAFAMLSVVDLQWVYLLCTFSFLAGLGLIWRVRPNPKSQDGPTFTILEQ
jgi:MFS family permease